MPIKILCRPYLLQQFVQVTHYSAISKWHDGVNVVVNYIHAHRLGQN
jgi:hypothetical protein